MDNENSGMYQTDAGKSSAGMATASLVMGILAAVMCCCGGVSVIFGCLGVIFALLSRTGPKMDGKALAGLILSVTGFILTLLLWLALLIGNTAGDFIPVAPTLPEMENLLTMWRRLPGGGGGL